MTDTHQQKTSLSFSIDNILRDDFPKQRKPRISAVSFPTVQSKFGRWPSAPFYRCFAVRYNPVLVRLLPNMQRFGERLQQANRVRELILAHQTEKRAEEGSLRTDYDKEEDFQDNEDEIEEDKAKQHPQQDKCIKEKSLQRKRRIRSHFTQRQLQYLEKIFSRQQYLTRDERTLLARGLEMTELQIRNWFQNKRYQKKHRAISNDSKADKEDQPEKPDTSMDGNADV
ncbi:uncharacterized protein [Porites lutea]